MITRQKKLKITTTIKTGTTATKTTTTKTITTTTTTKTTTTTTTTKADGESLYGSSSNRSGLFLLFFVAWSSVEERL